MCVPPPGVRALPFFLTATAVAAVAAAANYLLAGKGWGGRFVFTISSKLDGNPVLKERF
jgi:hypothetical protein